MTQIREPREQISQRIHELAIELRSLERETRVEGGRSTEKWLQLYEEVLRLDHKLWPDDLGVD